MTGAVTGLLAAASATPAPSGTASSIAQDFERYANSAALIPCGAGDGTTCGALVDLGLSEGTSRFLVLYGTPLLRVLIIVAVALVLRSLLLRLIHRLSERIATGEAVPGRSRRWGRARASDPAVVPAAPGAPDGTIAWERRAQRARTIGSVLRSTTTGLIGLVVALLVLGEVGIDLAPLIAGAGVVGVAIGFGAQTLVKDFLSGVFLIAEDQYGVGDSVDLGATATGTVEAVGLRVTRLRAVDGTVWYVRNGDVLRVGNRSQGWARTVLDVDVPYGEDAERVSALLAEVADGLAADPEWAEHLLEEPQVWGLEALTLEKVVVRIAVRTAPLQQWAVARELRARIKARFDAEGIGHPDDDAEAAVRT